MIKLTKRLATAKDLPQVLSLIEDGKKQMKAKGVTQWDKSYPTSDIVKSDIRKKTLWLYGKGDEACVTVDVSGDTVSVHRLVVSSLYKEHGLAKLILQDILDYEITTKRAKQVKIVTNHSNQSMLKLLSAKKFTPIRSFKVKGRVNYGSFIEFSRKL